MIEEAIAALEPDREATNIISAVSISVPPMPAPSRSFLSSASFHDHANSVSVATPCALTNFWISFGRDIIAASSAGADAAFGIGRRVFVRGPPGRLNCLPS